MSKTMTKVAEYTNPQGNIVTAYRHVDGNFEVKVSTSRKTSLCALNAQCKAANEYLKSEGIIP